MEFSTRFSGYSNHFEQAASLTNEFSGEHEGSQISVNNNPQTQGSNNLVETPVGTTFTSSPESSVINPIVTQREGDVVDLIGVANIFENVRDLFFT